jgi:hypothetical protein
MPHAVAVDIRATVSTDLQWYDLTASHHCLSTLRCGGVPIQTNFGEEDHQDDDIPSEPTQR